MSQQIYEYGKTKDSPALGVYRFETPDMLEGWKHALSEETCVRMLNLDAGRKVAQPFRLEVAAVMSDEKCTEAVAAAKVAHRWANEEKDWAAFCQSARRIGTSDSYRNKIAKSILARLMKGEMTAEQAKSECEGRGITL